MAGCKNRSFNSLSSATNSVPIMTHIGQKYTLFKNRENLPQRGVAGIIAN